MKCYVGIDPGKNGGIVCITEDGLNIGYMVMPVNDGGRIDIGWLGCTGLYLPEQGTELEVVCIEDVHSVFGSSAKSNFQFGKAVGVIEAAAELIFGDFEKVQPKEWQKEMFKDIEPTERPGSGAKGRGRYDTKAMAAEAFKKIFPQYVDDFKITAKGNKSKKLHDGLVDAALIAEYARRTHLC